MRWSTSPGPDRAAHVVHSRWDMLMRSLLLMAVFACWHGVLHAAQECAPMPASEQRKSAEPIVDWYDNYIRPYRGTSGDASAARLTKSQVEAYIEASGSFLRRAVLDSFIFETLVQQIADSYARAGDF